MAQHGYAMQSCSPNWHKNVQPSIPKGGDTELFWRTPRVWPGHGSSSRREFRATLSNVCRGRARWFWLDEPSFLDVAVRTHLAPARPAVRPSVHPAAVVSPQKNTFGPHPPHHRTEKRVTRSDWVRQSLVGSVCGRRHVVSLSGTGVPPSSRPARPRVPATDGACLPPPRGRARGGRLLTWHPAPSGAAAHALREFFGSKSKPV